MVRKSPELLAEPELLIWARESAGRTISQAAKYVHVGPERILKWESGQEKPTVAQGERLARVYKRPFAVFFLRKPPQEPPLPRDFRTLPLDQRLPLSTETRFAVRKARRIQKLFKELTSLVGRELSTQIGSVSSNQDPEEVASKVRTELGVEITVQLSHWRSPYDALNGWKRVLENLGILVFEFELPVKETRGFSLTDDDLPAIILNRRDSVRARIFSLFHEHAHILLKTSGICDMEEREYAPQGTNQIETFCNHFAGAVLVPRGDLLYHRLVRGVSRSVVEWPDNILQELADDFKVSRETVLRRLLVFGRTTRDFYMRKRREWKRNRERCEEVAKELRKEKASLGEKTYGMSQFRRCIRENGVPFVSLVLDAYRTNRINLSDVADYLQVRVKHLPKIERAMATKT